jgi:hypothetical protein
MDFLTPEEENIFEAIIDGTIFLALDGITITDELRNIIYTPLENVKPNHHEKGIPIRFNSDICKL